jgi:hypothetical protein
VLLALCTQTSDVNGFRLDWPLVALCAALMAGLVAVTFAILRQIGRGAEVTAVLCDGSPLRMLTVASIVATVMVLALSGHLQSEAVATILSGIAGYVLGGAHKPPAPAKVSRTAPSDDHGPL